MYSMKETCEKVGMTYETLKYYCNEGLIPNVKRDKNNYRIFDDNNISWIKSLTCLKRRIYYPWKTSYFSCKKTTAFERNVWLAREHWLFKLERKFL